MISGVSYTERETGERVSVDSVFGWDAPPCVIVTFSSGKRYALDYAKFERHFEIVSPQEVFMKAFGGVHDRPTAKQKEADAAG